MSTFRNRNRSSKAYESAVNGYNEKSMNEEPLMMSESRHLNSSRSSRLSEEKGEERREKREARRRLMFMTSMLEGVELIDGEWTLKKGIRRADKSGTAGVGGVVTSRTEERYKLKLCKKLIKKSEKERAQAQFSVTREGIAKKRRDDARLEREERDEKLRTFVSTKHRTTEKLPDFRAGPTRRPPPTLYTDDSSVASFVSRSSYAANSGDDLRTSTYYKPASIVSALGRYEKREILINDPFRGRYEATEKRLCERAECNSKTPSLPYGEYGQSQGERLISPPMNVKAQRRHDTEQLAKFYNALGGADWIKQDGWPCYQYFDPYTPHRNIYVHEAINMHGVLTKLYTQHLIEIRLKRNRLRGAFPNDIIGDMLLLEKLDLTDNRISGHIEDYTFGRLKELRVIVLHGNKLHGEIPGGGLMRLDHLHELTLSKNCFTGRIPTSLDTCKNLTHLCLFSNRLSGHIPESICFLKKLISLQLHDNCLTGPIPQRLASISTLRVISLYKNSLTGTVPKALASMESLDELLLSRNRLRGFVPETVAELRANVHLLEDKAALDLLPMGEAAELEPVDNDVCSLLQKPWTQRDFLVAESNASGNKWLVYDKPPNL